MIKKNKYLLDLFINNLLMLTGLATIISGFVLQLGFHLGGPERPAGQNVNLKSATFEQIRVISPDKTVWGIDYTTWSVTHKGVIVVLLLLMIYHFIIHLKWYKAVFTKHLVKKNRQVIVLSFLFVIVALTGLVPWFLDLSGNKDFLSFLFIEIHDKISILLTIYLILHITGRVRWFLSTIDKYRKMH